MFIFFGELGNAETVSPAGSEAGCFPLATLRAVEAEYGQDGVKRIEEWRKIINTAWFLDDLGKLEVVNRFVNKVGFVEDRERWLTDDYWATPYEFIAGNAGDCEDYALAKYFTLRAMGVSQDRLRIAYVRIKNKTEPHMVLFYLIHSVTPPLVLDNLEKHILFLDRKKYVQTVYTANEEYVWGTDHLGNSLVLGEQSLLHKLAGVIEKMSQRTCWQK